MPLMIGRMLIVALDDESQEDVTAFSRYFNEVMSKDEELKQMHIIPINERNSELLYKVKDGILLAKFVNFIAHGLALIFDVSVALVSFAFVMFILPMSLTSLDHLIPLSHLACTLPLRRVYDANV